MQSVIDAIEEARDDTREGIGTVGDMVMTRDDDAQKRRADIIQRLERIEKLISGSGMGAGSKSRRSKRRKPKKGKKGKKGKSKRRRRSRNN